MIYRIIFLSILFAITLTCTIFLHRKWKESEFEYKKKLTKYRALKIEMKREREKAERFFDRIKRETKEMKEKLNENKTSLDGNV